MLDVDADPNPFRILEERHPLGRGRWHAHRKHQLLLTRHGVLEFEGGQRSALLTPGVGAWIPSGMRHVAHARSDAVLLAVYVAPDRLPETLLRAALTVFALPAWWSRMLGHIHSLSPEEHQSLGEPWLPHLGAWSQKPWPIQLATAQDPQLRRACAMVRSNTPLAKVAKAVGLSPRTLARRAKKELGEGLGSWGLRRRLLEAAVALASSDKSLGQIAFDAGFASQSSFTYAFRRELNESPGQFRQRRLAEDGAG